MSTENKVLLCVLAPGAIMIAYLYIRHLIQMVGVRKTRAKMDKFLRELRNHRCQP